MYTTDTLIYLQRGLKTNAQLEINFIDSFIFFLIGGFFPYALRPQHLHKRHMADALIQLHNHKSIGIFGK